MFCKVVTLFTMKTQFFFKSGVEKTSIPKQEKVSHISR